MRKDRSEDAGSMSYTEYREMDPQVAAVLQKQHMQGNRQLRFSQFVLDDSREGEVLLFHLLTRQVVGISQGEYETLKSGPLSLGDSTSGLTKELFEAYYLVNEDLEEDAFYVDLLDMLDTVLPQAQGIVNYTILPTTSCNARCFYCFERGRAYETMTEKVVRATVDFIVKSHPEGQPVNISWFGGEPLMGSNQIRQICDGLKEAGVEYSSSMVSNGMLFDDQMVAEAKEDWHVRQVQITLDGFEEEHNRRKNIYAQDQSAYQLTRSAIDRLAKAEVSVLVRLNYDDDNMDEIQALRTELEEEYADNQWVRVYSSILNDCLPKAALSASIRRMEHWEAEEGNGGISVSWSLLGPHLKRRFCMANNPQAVLIGARGELYDCEHLDDERIWGTVFEGCTNPELYKRMKEREPVSEKCTGCRYLPYCTTYTHCPFWGMICKEELDRRFAQAAQHFTTDA